MNTRDFRRKCVDEYKLSNGCAVCGYNKHPCSLCFDHLPNFEKAEICKNGYSKSNRCGGMQMLYAKKHSVDELIDEIKKCRVLCMNCHMEETYNKHSIVLFESKMTIDELEKKLKND